MHNSLIKLEYLFFEQNIIVLPGYLDGPMPHYSGALVIGMEIFIINNH